METTEKNYVLNLKAINTTQDLIEVLFLLGVLKQEHQVVRMTDEQYVDLSKRGLNSYFSVLHKIDKEE